MSSAQPIPFITLPNWVKAATVCGFNIGPIFDRHGVSTDLIRLEEATVTAPQLGLVMEDCVSAAGVMHFPFVLGEQFAFDYLPDIGTFIATSPTLRHALSVFDWVRDLINPMIDFRLETEGHTARLAMQGWPGPASELDRYFIESIFAVVVRFGRSLMPGLQPFSRLYFTYAPPTYVAVYAEHFGIPVRFSAPFNALELPVAALDEPLDSGFPSLHRQAEQRVRQRLAQQQRRTPGLIAAVESALEAQPHLFGLGIVAVADELGVPVRTLQRRLTAAGESYAVVRDRVRYRLALRMLQAPAPHLESISEILGFSDRRSFTRAFTRWSGAPPGHFRRRGV